MATYSSADDMLTGAIEINDLNLKQKYVQDAADEIDSKLGVRWVTPIVIPDTPTTRSSMLLLKRINNWLASGWYILAVSVSDESTQNNAYGLKLVEDATAALSAIAAGTIPLPGATTLDSADQGLTGPLLNNIDQGSNVESFYGFAANPPLYRPTPPIFPAGGTQQPPNVSTPGSGSGSGGVSDSTKAPIENPVFIGTVTIPRLIKPGVIVPVGIGHAQIDAMLGDDFEILATSDFILDAPLNPANDQTIMIEITQDATGSRIMTMPSVWSFGTDLTSITLSTTPNATDMLLAKYKGSIAKWRVLSFTRGFQ